MVPDQGPGPAPAKVRAVQVVSTQLLEGVVEVVELANTVGLVMVEGPGRVQGPVHIVKDPILLMVENLPMLVVLVVVEEEPVGVRVMSAASVGVGRGPPGRLDAGMSMERCGRSGRWSSDDDAGFFAVGDEVVVVSCKLKGVTRTRNE